MQIRLKLIPLYVKATCVFHSLFYCLSIEIGLMFSQWSKENLQLQNLYQNSCFSTSNLCIHCNKQNTQCHSLYSTCHSKSCSLSCIEDCVCPPVPLACPDCCQLPSYCSKSCCPNYFSNSCLLFYFSTKVNVGPISAG